MTPVMRPAKRATCFWCGIVLAWSSVLEVWYGIDRSTRCSRHPGLHLAQKIEDPAPAVAS
jgi:hypothetical protein